jgi:hypothetical protein
MSFFKKKEKNFDSEVPEFGSNPVEKPKMGASEVPKLPNYNNEFGTIKKEIGRPKPAVQMPKISIPERKKSEPINTGISAAGDKPIFVKIENYKDAMDNLNNIQELCKEADDLLDNIHKIRSDEDRELEKWHKDLDKVKDRLLNVDKKLFEM